MTKVYIVHGYQADPTKHWFPWLKQSLELEGHEVEILNLPDSSHPKVDVWLDYMNENVKEVNSDTIFVTHSLGAITTLKFLNDLDVNHIGSLAIVSGFKDGISDMPELEPFVQQDVDFENLQNKILHRFGIAAKNDTVVPYEATKRLCDVLDAKFYLQEEGGHFCEQDGFDSFLFLKKKILTNFD
ncbi:RBBP9/YdeN family alpha/beta hydrolase [Staphylococcus coagulans]|uniref:RBBP9/YdeN family alpha/beta hydrolase n=1 Tax=Staphylococcus coagulans TaxID=74706 RepID=UPI001F4C2E9B|nr:alpha/beta hydrolase [Staphylococcus coagulans]UNB47101.1 alpha/beta hydrolase [Staphylococcus coagulans]